LQAEKEKLTVEKEKYQRKFRETQDKLASMGDHVEELEEITKTFGERNADLEKQKDTAEGREHELKVRNDNMAFQLQEMREHIQTVQDREQSLQDQNKKLRSWVTKSTNEPIDDNTVATRFASLRDQIQRIVFKFYPIGDGFQPNVWHLSQRQRGLFEPLQHGLKPAAVKYRIRAIIFCLLNEAILSKRLFGLCGFEPRGELDLQLARFEHALATTDKGKILQVVLECSLS
jgi:hypothetical protein